MLDTAAAAVPSLWSSVHGWLTPAMLFVLVNLVIGTIAVASRSMSSAPGDGEHRGALLRAQSLAFDRLRSFSFSRFPATAPFDGATEPPELEREDELEHERAHIERSRSEAAAGEAPAPRLPARMRRSASEMSAFAHFAPAAEEDDEDEEVVVEARRPATAREAEGGVAHHIPANDNDGDVEEEPPPVEVDARADDFIRQFREQLRLQRLDSVLRYRDMLRRGHHAGTG